MKIEIKHRFSGATLFECDLPAEIAEQSKPRQLGYAVKQALFADADLADAYLARANLADADLADAYLARANLADAYLAGANLARAYLADAYLAGANLAGAYLAGANLAGANLARANLAGANLAGANLAGAYLADARNAPKLAPQAAGSDPVTQEQLAAERKMPRWEREQRRAERFRERNPDVPVIHAIDSQILAAVEGGTGLLDMSQWHAECGTSHCRAGWAITLAGDQGKDLERKYGPACAGRMIYTASAGYTPHFFATNDVALADIRERAAEQADAPQ